MSIRVLQPHQIERRAGRFSSRPFVVSALTLLAGQCSLDAFTQSGEIRVPFAAVLGPVECLAVHDDQDRGRFCRRDARGVFADEIRRGDAAAYERCNHAGSWTPIRRF